VSDIYQENILDHYKNPRNYGRLDEATASSHVANPLCGDSMDLFLKISDGRVEDARFEAEGCAISKASASMLTERIKGRELGVARAENKDTVLASLGIPVSPVRMKCALLVLDALKVGLLEAVTRA
jgi:nitrogen fixation NifU-like protein